MEYIDAVSLFHALAKTHGLQDWGLEFSYKLNRASVQDRRRKRVVFSSARIREATEGQALKITLHAIAHALRPNDQHDEGWRKVAARIGVKLDYCTDREEGADNIYTPKDVARDMVTHFKPSGVILDPCRGMGAFYDLLPKSKGSKRLWCEVDNGRDFLDFSRRVDWIIGNPPYSIFREFLTHSFEIADNICYFVYLGKIFGPPSVNRSIRLYGGIREIRYYGGGGQFGFPFGYMCAAVHINRWYIGDIKQTYWPEYKMERKCGSRSCKEFLSPGKHTYCDDKCKAREFRARRTRAGTQEGSYNNE